MLKKYTHKSITWIDSENPTTEEVRSLMEEYDISPTIAKELQLPSYKEKIVVYKNYLYMVMHFPAFRHSHNNSQDQEIDFIVGKNFIITTRYETIDAFERFSKSFEVNDILGKGIMEDHAGYVLYYIIKELYRTMSDELDSMNDNLKCIEKNIFKGKEREMVTEISKANRDLINLNHIIVSHKEVLESLENKNVVDTFFDPNFTDNFSKILDEYYRIEDTLKNNIEFLKELRDTNDSLLSSKQNETMKILTVITFLTLPITVINDFFEINMFFPVTENDISWKLAVLTELLAVTMFYIFAKHKKWI